MDSMEQASVRILLFAMGIFFAIFLPALPDANYLAPIALLVFALLRHRLMVLPGFFLLGLGWHMHSGQQVLAVEIPAAWEHRPLQAEGVVRSLPQRFVNPDGSERLRFELVVDRIAQAGKPLSFKRPLTLALSWSRAPSLAANQRWQLEIQLQRPRSLANPGTFDYRIWLLARGIGGTGHVLASTYNRPLGAGGLWLLAARQWYSHKLQLQVEDKPVAALLQALAIGDKSRLSQQQRQVLVNTGTAHLMVISGLHIGLCAMVGFGLFYLIGSYPPRRVQSGGARLFASGGALLLAAVYAALAGFTVPTQRALLMLLVYLTARILHRETTAFQVLAIVLLVVLLGDPLAVIDTGFWLSFCAVALLLIPSRRRYGSQRLPLWGLELQLRLLIGLCPLMALLLGQSSPLAPLVNLAAIPFLGFIVVPLLLAALLFLPLFEPFGQGLLACCAWLMEAYWQLLSWVAGIGFGGTLGGLYATGPAMFLAALGVLLYLLPRGFSGRMAWPLLFLPLLLPAPRVSKELDIYVLDVGQGTSILVQTPGHVMLYDAGPAYPGGYDSGRSVVLPFLRRLGIRRIDRLVVSHNDNDHSGGVASVRAGMAVQQVMAPAALSSGDEPDIVCQAGLQWRWDEVTFKVLHPGKPLPGKSNNRSCVIAIESPSLRVLLAGDIERSVERELVSRYGPGLRSDVLFIPHHGSRSSSSYAFTWFTRPATAVATVGYRNRFGHPAKVVTDRYQERGSAVVTTAEAGALHFDALGGYRPFRWFYTRYWQHYPCKLAGGARASWVLFSPFHPGLFSQACESPWPVAVEPRFMW